MKLKVKLKNVQEPSFVAGHCATRPNATANRSKDILLAMYEADSTMEYGVEGETFANCVGGVDTYHKVSCLIVDMDMNMIVSRFAWDDLPNIKYGNSADYIAVDPVTGEPEPPRDWLVDTIDFPTASPEEQQEFLNALSEKGNTLDKAMSIEPKAGDWVRCINPHTTLCRRIIENKDISFAEALRQSIVLLKDCSRDDSVFDIRYGVIDRIDGEQDRVEVSSWYHKYEVLDPLTGEAKVKDVALIREGITEMLEFCDKNNYHDVDEDLRGITW